MKNTSRNVVFALLLLGGVAGSASAATSVSAGIRVGPSGRSSVDLGFFYDDLASYGNWIERAELRLGLDTGRSPRAGAPIRTDTGSGRTTAGSGSRRSPTGWATYHYGRWYDDPEIGWSWVPGDEWDRPGSPGRGAVTTSAGRLCLPA